MAFKSSDKVQFEQNHLHLCGFQTGVADDFINPDRGWPQRIDDETSFVFLWW
jgi:hypothetical protein